MSLTQEGRQLKILTPLGDDHLLLDRISVSEGISQLFRYELDLLHEEPETGDAPTVIDVQKILGQPVTIAMIQRDGTERFWHGIVVQFAQGQRDDDFTHYRAVVVPYAWVLTQTQNSRIFQNKTVPDILKEVFKGLDYTPVLQGTFEPRNYCVQYRESDWDFASRLMEEEGIFYFFEQTNGNHKLIIANTPQSHRDCPSKDTIEFSLEAERVDDFRSVIGSWFVEHNLRTGLYTLWDYNFELPKKHLEAAQPTCNSIGGNNALEIYDFPAGYSRKQDGISRDGGEQSGNLQKIFTDNQKTAKIRMEEIDAQYKIINGTSDCASLTAGHRFTLESHPTRSMNGLYARFGDARSFAKPGVFVWRISGKRIFNQFTCIPHQSPYRPQRVTEKPSVRGSQTATVVGPAGEEIFTDKYGRVKVQFHWDRQGKFDADSSCWIRVARDLAGKKWGAMHIPRIGQEVIVDFFEGDPDQPIITGSVYNAETMPHYELPKFKTLTYIKTRTSPDDGKGYNELRFEDKKDKEQVFIRSQKRMDVRVRSSLYETCGGDRQEVIGVRADDKPGGNLATTVGGSHDLHIKADEFIGVDGKLNIGVKGDMVEDFQSNLQTVVASKAELNANSITLEAMTKITLKVGGSFITVDQSGVTISGMMVKINSGGAGAPTGPATIDDPLDAETADTGEPGYLDKPRSGGGGKGRNRRTLKGQHAPPFPTKTLPGGDIQVGNSIVIKKDPNDPTFQDKVLRDMTTMSNHPTGMETLNNLNNGGQKTTVQHSTGSNSTNYDNVNDAAAKGKPDMDGNPGTGNGTGSTINYNPDREPPTSANPNVKRPADVGLNHEMVHAVHGAQGTDDNSQDTANPNNPTVEETETINKDNQYRDERGIPRRRDHTTL